MKITILGCGPSYGVPSLGRGFGECDPANPKNTRTRSAILVETPRATLLIDSGPEIRMQLIHAGVPKPDAVLYTHDHFDHMGGANDLRALAVARGGLDVWLTQKDEVSFRDLLAYIFQNPERNPFMLKRVKPYQTFVVKGERILPILQYHGTTTSIGYRIGDFAYSTDVKHMDEAGFMALAGIDTWVLGVVTRHENPKHVHLDKAIEWIEQIKPQRVYLTHMGQRMDYDVLCRALPDYIRPAYDGLSFRVG